MSKPILWVGWMSRWGEPAPTHAYSTGVYDSPDAARKAGGAENQYRGGKYEFQHSPCRLDLLDDDDHLFDFELYANGVELPDKVIVASVTHPGIGKFNERHHLLGVFTSEERATELADVLYPGWNLYFESFEVTRTEEKR